MSKKPVTRGALVRRAYQWLRNSSARCCMTPTSSRSARCRVALSQVRLPSGEAADALGWTPHGSVLVRCAATLAEARKIRRLANVTQPDAWVGNHRFLLVPAGVVSTADIPDGWGLLLFGPHVRVVRASIMFPCHCGYERSVLSAALSKALRK